MLKYIKSYAASISGIDIYPLISLLIFFGFFVGVLYYVKNMDRTLVADMNNLPLEGDAANITSNPKA